jgi:hypothetical protein
MDRSHLRGQIDCTHRTRPAGNAFRSGLFHRTCCTGGMGSRMLCSSYVCSNCRRNIVCRDNWLLCALVVRISCKAQHPGNFVPNVLFHRTCCTGGMGNRMICSSYVGWNCTRNIACRDNWLLCALAVRISCKWCTRARNVRRCYSEGRFDYGTPCFYDGGLHLCIPCNIWGNLDIRLVQGSGWASPVRHSGLGWSQGAWGRP